MAQIMNTVIDIPIQDTRIGVMGGDLYYSDYWNMKRLINLHGQWFRYDTTSKAWLVWDNRKWVKDDRVKIEYLAKLTIMSIYDEAADEIDDNRRKSLAKHALKSESVGKIKAMVELAKSEPGTSVTSGDLDSNDWLLNLNNCTLDLRANEWPGGCPIARQHDQGDLITKASPVDFNPDAECPTWNRFLLQIMGGDMQLVYFLRRAVGYSLTGSDREQCLFFLYGSGSNGKSTFVNTIRDMFGDYSRNTQPDTFMRKDSNTVRDDVARLRGARLVTATETDEGQRMAENLIKQLTGGDQITARHLYGEHFEFKPTFKVWIAGNHKPVIRGTDHGIWRRIMLIPFTVKIADEDKDKDLAEKLRAELPGILNWALTGLESWMQVGLNPPQAVLDATKAYRDEMDHLGTYLNENCLEESGKYTLIGDLFIDYEKWCEANGEWSMSKRDLTRKMQERGLEKHKKNIGWSWKNLVLKSDKVTE